MSDAMPVQVRFPRDELAALDDYRRKHPNLPSRPKAIRELVQDSLERREASNGSAD